MGRARGEYPERTRGVRYLLASIFGDVVLSEVGAFRVAPIQKVIKGSPGREERGVTGGVDGRMGSGERGRVVGGQHRCLGRLKGHVDFWCYDGPLK